jgi:hypothetical protein
MPETVAVREQITEGNQEKQGKEYLSFKRPLLKSKD